MNALKLVLIIFAILIALSLIKKAIGLAVSIAGNGLNPLIVLCVAIRKFLIIMMFDVQANDRIM